MTAHTAQLCAMTKYRTIAKDEKKFYIEIKCDTVQSPKGKKWHSKPPHNDRTISKSPDMAF